MNKIQSYFTFNKVQIKYLIKGTAEEISNERYFQRTRPLAWR